MGSSTQGPLVGAGTVCAEWLEGSWRMCRFVDKLGEAMIVLFPQWTVG